jgi:hypothetical protein
VGRKKSRQDYFVRSGLKEISLLRKQFNIRGQGDDVRVAREVSPGSIKDFYREYFASVRPPSLGDDKILPRPDGSKLRAWYVGQPDVNVLLNLVVRHCLYVDQIVLVDPFIILPHDDVLERPQVWAQTVINRALCLCALENWIEQELILVIPSVFHYYPELRQLISENPYAFYPRHTDEQRQGSEHYFIARLLVNEPPDTRGALLDLIESMGRVFAEGERDELLSEAKQYEAKNPIRFRLSSSYYERHFKEMETSSQVLDFTLSVPLLLAPIIAEEIGAFLIFEHRLSYDLLLANQRPMSARSDSLQQLALAFQGLDFPFLHNVPLKQALDLRNRGYLNSFRVYLRELWSTVAEAEENESLDAKIFEFSDRCFC